LNNNSESKVFFYDGTVKDLKEKLEVVVKMFNTGSIDFKTLRYARDTVMKYDWKELIPAYDDVINRISVSKNL
jgi:hypothetical protein